MASNDPYYYSRDIMARQAQSKALGQSKGFTPDELSGIIRGNFQAQQEKETVQRKLALDTRNQALQESKAVSEAKQAKNASIGQTLYGGTSLALQAHKQGLFSDVADKTVNKLPIDSSINTGAVAMSPSSVSTVSDLANITNEARLGTMTGTQVAATAGEKAVGTSIGTLGGSLVSGVGWGGLSGAVAGQVVHGKHQKQASIGAATIAGAYAGSSAGPWGVLVGAIGGALSAIFG